MHWNGSGAQETLVLRDLVAYTRQLARMRAAALRVYCHQRRYLVAVSFCLSYVVCVHVVYVGRRRSAASSEESG